MELKRLQQGDAELAQRAIDRFKIPSSDMRQGPGLAYLSGFLQKPENVLIVASDEGVPVGFVLAYLIDRVDRDNRMMLFYEIEVSANYRRRGIARSMVEMLKSICMCENVFKMWVYTNRSNTAAVALYKAMSCIESAAGDEVSFTYYWG